MVGRGELGGGEGGEGRERIPHGRGGRRGQRPGARAFGLGSRPLTSAYLCFTKAVLCSRGGWPQLHTHGESKASHALGGQRAHACGGKLSCSDGLCLHRHRCGSVESCTMKE
jgi:hypothetical protein